MWLADFEFERLSRDHRFVFRDVEYDEAWSDKMATAIAAEFAYRKREQVALNLDSPVKWLKTICYNAILTSLHHDLFEDLEDRVGRYQRKARGPDGQDTIFTVGIMAIFAHDLPKGRIAKNSPRPLTDEKMRERMAKEMWWGFRHYVEPNELVAFNRRYPLHRQSPPPADDYLVPELLQQIVERRSLFMHVFGGNTEEARGRYPANIEDRVEAHSKTALLDEQAVSPGEEDDDDWGEADECPLGSATYKNSDFDDDDDW